MNKKILLFVIAPVLALALVTATVLTFMGQVQRDVTITESFKFVGGDASPITIIGGESVISEDLSVESLTSVVIPLSIETTPVEEGVEHTVNYLLDNSGGVCTPWPQETCEKRIFISAEDVGIETLDDLNSISWDANVLGGYITHVDVILETDALVFEYAKIDPLDCDDVVDYPTGEVNTFGDKGIIDADAYAWLSSGVPGYCGLPEFDATHNSLTEWKITRGSEKVIGFEIEVDNWVSPSNSEVKN
ncbi:hypothetical protein LCGC14_1861510, partial [marine sediment metagenome]